MLESTSLVSLDELEQRLKSLDERLKYLEKVVVPSRVTKEELHSGVSDAKIFVMTNVASIRSEIRTLKDQIAMKGDLENVKQELSQQIAARKAEGPRRIRDRR